jgi:hypothetical protein
MKNEQDSKSPTIPPSQTNDPQKRDWLRLVIMVENTDANRKIAGLLIAKGRLLAEIFEGKKIVKVEAVQVFGMDVSKEKTPEAKVLPNIPISATPQAGLEPCKRNGGEQ